MKKGMSDLREALFDVIERLKAPGKNPMDVDTAGAICLAAKRLLESAEIELEYRKNFASQAGAPSAFLEDDPQPRKLSAANRQ